MSVGLAFYYFLFKRCLPYSIPIRRQLSFALNFTNKTLITLNEFIAFSDLQLLILVTHSNYTATTNYNLTSWVSHSKVLGHPPPARARTTTPRPTSTWSWAPSWCRSPGRPTTTCPVWSSSWPGSRWPGGRRRGRLAELERAGKVRTKTLFCYYSDLFIAICTVYV